MSRISRIVKIWRIVAKYRLDDLLQNFSLPLYIKLPIKILCAPLGAAQASTYPRSKRLRLALEELGPIFIKFGQLLSTRRDFVPQDIADELQLLQDQVPAFEQPSPQSIVEKALGRDINHLFGQFDPLPLASASVAQVHSARLFSGEEVVVKILRPGIEKVIQQDIKLLHYLAGLIADNSQDGKRLRPREVVADYENVIMDELNLLAEGANTTQLRRNFENSPLLYVPKVYWDYSRRNILVMERIHGIAISNIEGLKQAGIDLKKLAETGVDIFFTQVFNHSFFHADMHPGNIFVSEQHPENPQYIAIDCAIIGSLSKDEQQYLARNLLAIFKRDYKRVAELHLECGWVPKDTRVNEFEAAMRSVCEPIFEKPLKDISFGLLLIQLFQTARRFQMEVQPSLVLLQKTLLNIEGLGRQLYPELDLWTTAMPFLENWSKQRLGPLSILKNMQDKAPEWIEQLPEIPQLVFDAMTQIKQQGIINSQLATLIEQQALAKNPGTRSKRRILPGLAVLVAAAGFTHPTLRPIADSMPSISWLLGTLGIYLLCFKP